VVLSTLRSLGDREYVISIVVDATLDTINTSFLLDTFSRCRPLSLWPTRKIGMMPYGTVSLTGQNELNIKGKM